MTEIYYNNQLVASGQAVPLVGRTEEMIRYGERWGIRSTVTLKGVVSGDSFAQLVAAQSGIFDDFSQDFQTFQIIEDGNVIYTMPVAWCRGINFGESKYVGLIPYVVSLECYEQDYFSGVYGITEPSNQWEYDQQLDGRVKITHTVSARGFNTSTGPSNAFQNAVDFVLANTGWSGAIFPSFISGFFTSPCLNTFAEHPNRMDGSYSVTENYVYDPIADSCVILRYQTDYDCNSKDKATTTVRGNVSAGLQTPMSALWGTLSNFNIVNAAYEVGGTGMNPQYVTSGLSVDKEGHKISFQVEFDNTPANASGVWFDYTIDDSVEDDGVTRCTLNGTIKGRGDLKTRWNNVYNYYIGLTNLPTIMSGYFDAFNNTPNILNPFTLSSGTTFNPFNAQINIYVTCDNRPTPTITGFSEIDYTYHFIDAVEKVGAIPLLANECNSNQNYYLTDLGYQNRAEFQLEGRALPSCGLNMPYMTLLLQGQLNQIMQTELSNCSNIVLTRQDFSNSNSTDGQIIRFSCAWSFVPDRSASTPNNYSQILDLGVN